MDIACRGGLYTGMHTCEHARMQDAALQHSYVSERSHRDEFARDCEQSDSQMVNHSHSKLYTKIVSKGCPYSGHIERVGRLLGNQPI